MYVPEVDDMLQVASGVDIGTPHRQMPMLFEICHFNTCKLDRVSLKLDPDNVQPEL